MKMAIVAILMLVGAAVFAQNSGDTTPTPSTKTPAKPAKAGYHDLAMPNFKGLDEAPPSDDSRPMHVHADSECTTPSGQIVKQGDPGFGSCINNNSARGAPINNSPGITFGH